MPGPDWWEAEYDTTTGPDGGYMITGIPAGNYVVATENSFGYIDEFYDDITSGWDWSSATLVTVIDYNDTPNINFSLEVGGSISGYVFREDGVTPLANVEVWAEESSFGHVGSAVTGPDGSYTITGLPSGNYVVSTENNLGYVDEFYDNILGAWYNWPDATRVAVIKPNNTPNINFSLEVGGSISGFVYKGDGVTPLANVTVWAEEDTFGYYRETTTASDGSYTLFGLPSGNYVIQTWSDQGYIHQYYNNKHAWDVADRVIVTAPNETSGINFNLEMGGAIEGWVTDEGGLGIEGVLVEVNDFNEFGNWWETWTGPGGYYCIGGLKTDDYRVETRNYQGYIDEFFDNVTDWEAATPVSVIQPNVTTNINFDLALGGSISGRVTDQFGIPITNGSVEVISTVDWRRWWGSTDSTGTYSVNGLPTGQYKIKVEADGYAREYWNDQTLSNKGDLVNVIAPFATANIDFDLAPGGSISGTIYEGNTSNKVKDFYVLVRPVQDNFDEGFWYWDWGGDGMYRAEGLPLGEYKIEVFAEGYRNTFYGGVYGWWPATEVTVVPPNDTGGIDVRMFEDSSIRGYVYDQNGDPLPWMDIHPDDISGIWTDRLHGFTNEDGYYEINGMAPGEFTLRFEGGYTPYATEYFSDKWTHDTADRIVVPPKVDLTNVNFNVELGAKLTGKVYDEAGTPLQGVGVSSELGSNAHDITKGDGSYELSVPSGDFRVGTNRPGYVNEWWNNHYRWDLADIISVTAPEIRDGIDFYLAEAGSISGTVYAQDGVTRIPGAEVYAFAVSGEAGNGIFADGNGNYKIENLPSGLYKVQAVSANYFTEFYDNKADEASANPVPVNAPADTPNIDFTLAPIDSNPPSVAVYAPWNNPTNNNNPFFIGTIFDGSPISYAVFSIDSGATWNWFPPIDGNYDEGAEAYQFNVGPLPDGNYTVQVKAGDIYGNETPPASYATHSFTIDTTAPSALVSAPAYSGLTSANTQFKVSWSANDPAPSSGVRGWDVQYRDGSSGTWVYWKRGTNSTSDYFLGTEGYTYYFRARATDNAGNTGLWSAAKSTVVPYDDENASFVYTGSWGREKDANYFQGSVKYSSTAGDRASFTFTGKAVALITTRGVDRGQARIYIDGALNKTVNAGASTTQYRNTIFVLTWPTAGNHTIEVEVVGTAGRPRFDVDGIAVLN